MELATWLSLALICMLGAMTPGPSLVVVLKHTISGGKVNGLAASIAHGFGVSLYALLTVLGMAIIIQQTPWLFNFIKYAGVIFLLWLAYKSLFSKSVLAKQSYAKQSVSLKKSCSEGFLIAFLNPKLAIFFLALFSQFLELDATIWQKALMVVTVGLIDTLWYCLIAAALSQSHVLENMRKNAHIIEKITGVVLIGISVRVLL